jgi:hypothetical protein
MWWNDFPRSAAERKFSTDVISSLTKVMLPSENWPLPVLVNEY